MTRNDSAQERPPQPAPSTPEGLGRRTLPDIPAPPGDGPGAGEATGLLGGDASMTEANLALETQTGGDPAES